MSNEQLDRHPMELTTQEGKNLIDQIDDLKPVSADSVGNQPFAQVYRESPLFRAYHNSEMLEGKCNGQSLRRRTLVFVCSKGICSAASDREESINP